MVEETQKLNNSSPAAAVNNSSFSEKNLNDAHSESFEPDEAIRFCREHNDKGDERDDEVDVAPIEFEAEDAPFASGEMLRRVE